MQTKIQFFQVACSPLEGGFVKSRGIETDLKREDSQQEVQIIMLKFFILIIKLQREEVINLDLLNN